jgi:iron complex transport system ATP-binding protein
MSVESLVACGCLGRPGSHAIADALNTMDLGELAARHLSSLSGGERARAMLARVLAGAPQWLLADEPLAHLDLAHGLALMASLRAQAVTGLAWRWCCMTGRAMNHADRVLVLSRGELVADGPPDQALAADVLAQVWGVRAQWLGEPGARALALG